MFSHISSQTVVALQLLIYDIIMFNSYARNVCLPAKRAAGLLDHIISLCTIERDNNNGAELGVTGILYSQRY